MRHWIFGLLLVIANPFAVRAEPFERAEVTKAINLVSLLPRNTRAVPGVVVSGDSALKTGGNSRAELEFPDLTITRVGSNALFRFLAGGRESHLGWRHHVIFFAGRRRRRKGSGGRHYCGGHGNGFFDFENQRNRRSRVRQAGRHASSVQQAGRPAAGRQATVRNAGPNLSAFTQEAAKLEAAS